jgi:hypothetical protein
VLAYEKCRGSGESLRGETLPGFEPSALSFGGSEVKTAELLGTEMLEHPGQDLGHEADQPIVERHEFGKLLAVDELARCCSVAPIQGFEDQPGKTSVLAIEVRLCLGEPSPRAREPAAQVDGFWILVAACELLDVLAEPPKCLGEGLATIVSDPPCIVVEQIE